MVFAQHQVEGPARLARQVGAAVLLVVVEQLDFINGVGVEAARNQLRILLEQGVAFHQQVLNLFAIGPNSPLGVHFYARQFAQQVLHLAVARRPKRLRVKLDGVGPGYNGRPGAHHYLFEGLRVGPQAEVLGGEAGRGHHRFGAHPHEGGHQSVGVRAEAQAVGARRVGGRQGGQHRVGGAVGRHVGTHQGCTERVRHRTANFALGVGDWCQPSA